MASHRKAVLLVVAAAGLVLGLAGTCLGVGKPVYIGLDAEFGYTASTSAEAIREGAQIAIEEINRAGGRHKIRCE